LLPARSLSSPRMHWRNPRRYDGARRDEQLPTTYGLLAKSSMDRRGCITTRRVTLTRRLVGTLRAMEKDCWEGSIPTSTCAADQPCWSMLKVTLHRFRVQMSFSTTYSAHLRAALWSQQWRSNTHFRKPANPESPGHTTALRMRLGTARGLARWHASRVSIVLEQWASTMKFKTSVMGSH